MNIFVPILEKQTEDINYGSLVHEPKILIMDEPFAKLNCISIRIVEKSILEFDRNKGNLVVFTVEENT